ncbi:MAG: hypothetical protein Q8S32_01360 [Burkholderiaceae bacterium]|jgi:hypothetical protein|nr:hypothetical protein [Burkholderiaceae bacterium]MDP3134654.1 hypothetical protein [Burkholderiaceae bacterium]MDP3422390.1 hypothetical protein [Burkholderiaceae bacterium]MDZ4161688.1 hypothetical protein [Burkholderiales bacterium]
MTHSLQRQRLGALFVLGGWLFNFPLLAVWDSEATAWGLPVFPLALFVLWAGLIAATAWVLEGSQA